MTDEDRDRLKKRRKYLRKCLRKIEFPYTELEKIGYDVNYLLKVLEEILDIDLEKNQLERLVINIKEKSNIKNYRDNFFYNFLKPSDEKNLNNFLKKLLKKYDNKKYEFIEFDERGNIYPKENFSNDDFIIQVEEFFEMSQKLQEKLIDKIFNGETLHDLDKLINNLKIEAVFCNDNVENSSQEILRIFIIFIYWEWQKMLLENMIVTYKKGFNEANDYLKVPEKDYSKILSLNALSKFLNRNRKNKRDTILKEKLKKLYIFTEGKLKDYSLDKNYPMSEFDVLIIDNIFQNIFFNDEKIWKHKLDYYLEVYRKNHILNKLLEKLDIFEKISITIIYKDEFIKLVKEILLDMLKIYEDFYTPNELKKFNKIKIETKKELSFLEKLQECDETELIFELKNRNKENGNKCIEKIYKILILSEINDTQKIFLIGSLIEGFKIDNCYYTKSEVLKGRYFENIKPLNRVIDTYLGILLNMHHSEELKRELLKIIYLLEKFRDIKPKLY